jgi:glycine/serine hydroxymethyltransferase
MRRYPGKRYYGCEVVDIVEQIAIDRAKNYLVLVCKCAATLWFTS